MQLILIESFKHFNDILNNNEHEIIIINVSATWCKPCNAIKEDFSSFIKQYNQEKCICLKIDYDLMEEEVEFHEILDVKKIPYFFIFHLKNKTYHFQSSCIDIIQENIQNHINMISTDTFDINEDF